MSQTPRKLCNTLVCLVCLHHLSLFQTEQELILREYERSCADEEAELCAVVDDYLSTRNDDVLCPVCTRTNLIKPAHNLIACRACGLRLDLDCDVISMTEV